MLCEGANQILLNTNRYILLLRRFLRARAFGVWFTGTSGFRMPGRIRLAGRTVALTIPEEAGPGLDFINVALDDEYGLRELPFEPRTILDVGANFGLFSLLAAGQFPAATIHAYEPNPRVYPAARANLELVNATAFQAGVGKTSGSADIRESGDSRLAQTVISASGAIQIVSLAEAITRLGGELDLLKLDCEGAEWDIFDDIESFRRVRAIRMEYHLMGGRTIDALTDCAERLNFRVARLEQNQGFGIAWMCRNGS